MVSRSEVDQGDIPARICAHNLLPSPGFSCLCQIPLASGGGNVRDKRVQICLGEARHDAEDVRDARIKTTKMGWRFPNQAPTEMRIAMSVQSTEHAVDKPPLDTRPIGILQGARRRMAGIISPVTEQPEVLVRRW
jgi:hypothetical protein